MADPFAPPDLDAPEPPPLPDFSSLSFAANGSEPYRSPLDELGDALVTGAARGWNTFQQMPAAAQITHGEPTPELIQEYLKQGEEREAYQYSEQTQRDALAFENAPDFMTKLGVVMHSPGLIGSWVSESLAVSIPSAVAGFVGGRLGGTRGAAVGVGLGSGGTEYVSSLIDYLGSQNVNLQDAASIEAAVNNPQLMSAAREYARERGVTVGVFDAITARLAPGVVQALRRREMGNLVPTGAGLLTEATGGATGEAAAELATTGRLDPNAIIPEFFGEIGGGATELASALTSRDQQPAAEQQLPDFSSLSSKPYLGAGVQRGPVSWTSPEAFDRAQARVNQQPSEAQRSAGNFQKGHVRWNGMRISLDGQGSGYIRGTRAKNRPHVGVTVGPNPQAQGVFLVDRINPDNGRYEGTQAFIGFDDSDSAREAYLSRDTDGRALDRVGAVSQVEIPQFREWLSSGRTVFDRKAVAQTRRALQTAREASPLQGGLNAGAPVGVSGTNVFGNLIEVHPRLKEGYGALDIPAQRAVKSGVLAALQDDEIFRSVIPSIPVDVMNSLAGQKSAAQNLFHDRAMFIDLFSRNMDRSITARVIDAIIGEATRGGAENPAFDVAGPTLNERPTYGAGERSAESLLEDPTAFLAAESLSSGPRLELGSTNFTTGHEGVSDASHRVYAHEGQIGSPRQALRRGPEDFGGHIQQTSSQQPYGAEGGPPGYAAPPAYGEQAPPEEITPPPTHVSAQGVLGEEAYGTAAGELGDLGLAPEYSTLAGGRPGAEPDAQALRESDPFLGEPGVSQPPGYTPAARSAQDVLPPVVENAGGTPVAPRLGQREQQILDNVLEITGRMARRGTRVSVVNRIETEDQAARAASAYGTSSDAYIAGSYERARRLMRIALEGNDQKPVAVHESWHSIEEDLDEAEIAVLRRERERLRKVAGRYLGADASNLSEQEVYANAAEAYWVKGQKQGIHIEVRRIFDRIREMLRRMRNYLHGEGYRTTEDIFKAFTEGEIAERGPTEGGGLEAETGEQLAAPRRAEKPVFYSALLQATETVPMKQGDAAQWMNALKKQPGVTKEEMDWLGLEDWLKERKGKISKSDVVDFVRSNQVQVEETLRGGGRGDYQVPLIWEGLQPPRGSRSFTRADSLTFEHDGDEFVYEVYRSNKAGEERTEIWTDESQILADDYHISDEEVEQAIRLHLSEFRDLEGVQRGGTKFAQYQGREGVRGDEGKNYGELLLTLPEEPQPVAVYKDDKLVGEFPSWTAARRVWENEHEAGLVVIRDIGKSRDNFTEGHFEEPNVLAHVRFNERESEDIDPDTEKARKARQDLSTEYRRASMALHQERLEAGRNVQRAAVRGEISADEAQRRMRDLDYPESELPSLARVKELSDQLRSAGFSPPPKEPKRILFLEEVQSDWGQKLRRERKKVKEAINRDFDGIAAKMVEAGLIQKDCD